MLLAIDTVTSTASLALYDLTSDQLLAEWTWQARRRQTQDLLGVAKQMLALVDLTPAQITALAVTTGPGSFTGVRIGISTVKGIALGLPTPPRVIGIPTLNVTAAPFQGLRPETRDQRPEANSGQPPISGLRSPVSICAYVQAGRGRYNWAYLPTQDALQRLTVEDHQAGLAAEIVADLQARADRHIWLVGEVTAELEQATAELAHITWLDGTSSLRRAGHLARLAARSFAAGIKDRLSDLQPMYLRQP